MKIYIPKYSGFCPGVKLAEKNLFEAKKNFHPHIYILGKLIHNTQYINYLSQNEIFTIESLEKIPHGATVAIRTHGIDQYIEKELRKKAKVLDLTCIKVKKLQKTIKEYSDRGFFIIITGKKEHPEVLGLKSYALNFYLIEEEEELDEMENVFREERLIELGKYKNILVVSQTTGDRELFEKVSRRIKNTFGKFVEIKIIDSICSITSLREEEALKMQKNADYTFVVGDHISSNARRLFYTLKKNKDSTFFIENLNQLKELNLPLKSEEASLIVSSSSTPEFTEKEIVKFLASI